MLRIIYTFLIRLHPPYFRKRFADEMLSIFDQERGLLAAVGVVADGAWSLLRQWTVRHEFWREPDLKIASEGGPSFHTLDDAELPRGAWFKGIALSVSVFCAFWLAIIFGQNKIPQGRPTIVQDYGLAVLSTRFDPNNFQSGPPALAVASMSTSPLHAQEQPSAEAPAPGVAASQPTFDVASIRPNTTGGDVCTRVAFSCVMDLGKPGIFTGVNQSLRDLIAAAYHLTSTQTRLISGAPKWMDSERFNIQATAEGNPGLEQKRVMLQSLLADRFKLVVHHETRQGPVYALVLAKVGKTGPGLVQHSGSAACIDLSKGPPPHPPRIGDSFCGGFLVLEDDGVVHVTANNTTTASLAGELGGGISDDEIDRAVLDRTGLNGSLDVTLAYTLSRSQINSTTTPFNPAAPPSLITALQEQLGLKLKPGRGPVDVLVIDHIEEPTPN